MFIYIQGAPISSNAVPMVLLSAEISTQVLALYLHNMVPTMVYQVVFLHENLFPMPINALKCGCSLELVN